MSRLRDSDDVRFWHDSEVRIAGPSRILRLRSESRRSFAVVSYFSTDLCRIRSKLAATTGYPTSPENLSDLSWPTSASGRHAKMERLLLLRMSDHEEADVSADARCIDLNDAFDLSESIDVRIIRA
jgi:hypothetical protein